MSSRKYILTLSDEAKHDFRDILSYTLQMWGEHQFLEYKNLLNSTLTSIEQVPEAGRTGFSPYLYTRAGKHYIFYKIIGDAVSVSRILHGSMDFIPHLEDAP